MLAPLLGALAVAGLAELALQRTFYRVGIFIPKRGPFWTAYRTGTALGSFAFNLANVLVIAVLGILAVRAARAGRTVIAGLTASLVVLGLAGIGLRDAPGASELYRLLFFATAVAILAHHLTREESGFARAASLGLLVVFGCSAYYGVATGLSGVVAAAGAVPGATTALTIGEMAAVLLGPAFFLAWRDADPSRSPVRALTWAAVPAAAFAVAQALQPRITGILVIWTVGFAFVIPAVVYAVSLWLFSAAAIGWLLRSETRTRGIGLILLLVGGYFPQTTYDFMVTTAALLLLTGGAHGPEANESSA